MRRIPSPATHAAQRPLLLLLLLLPRPRFEHGSAPPLDLFTKGLLHGQFGNSEALEMERELLQVRSS